MKHYRAEVDGLRAIAVLPVILFHAGCPGVSGGFLGVDVFFVISGYLISSILLDEFAGSRFDLLSFYERRARRILPLLFVVMAFTFPATYFLAPPETFASYLESLRATALFFSNVHFWQGIGYFNPNAEEQPLLHTWSLGVEEQFYILFPLLLWAVWRFARRHLLIVFTVFLIAGFAICLLQVSQSKDAAFFLLHARAWELIAGVIVALLERKMDFVALRSRRLAQALATAGLAIILTAVFMVSNADNVPGWLTLCPVGGTALVLLFADKTGLAGRLLTAKPVVAFGLVSYGAYLWHHPLFAFARLYEINQPRLLTMLVLSILAVILAVLTYFLVEKPFRDRKRMSPSVILALTPLAILTVVATAEVGLRQNWPDSRFAPALLAKISPLLHKTENCDWISPVPDIPEIQFCRLGEVNALHPVILWGDSHAQALVGEFDKALARKGWSGIYVNTNKCLRVPGIYDFNSKINQAAKECLVKHEAALRTIARLKPRAIVVNMRWTLRLFPVPGAGTTVGFDNGEGGVEVESDRRLAALGPDGNWSLDVEAKAEAVNVFFGQLTSLAPLVVVGPVPEVGWHVGNRNFKSMVLHHETMPDINTSHDLFKLRNQSALAILDKVSKGKALTLVEPSSMFCNTMLASRCVAQHNGISYYADDDHLSQTGARMVVDQIMTALPILPSSQP